MSEHAEPPVNENKKVASGVHECPAKAHQHCEMKELELKVGYMNVNWVKEEPGKNHASPDILSPTTTVLKTDRIKRNDKLTPAMKEKLGHEMVALLGRYDFVIDALAGFHTNEKPPESFAEIEVKAEGEGKCPHEQHVVVSMTPLRDCTGIVAGFKPVPIQGEESMVLRHAVWKPEQSEITVKDVLAPTYNADLGSGENVFGKLFQLFMFVFHANRSADIEFRATTCGKASATEEGPAEFIALVRVFRDISVAVGFKCPPPMSYSEEVKGSLGVLTGAKEMEAKFKLKDSAGVTSGEFKGKSETHREGAFDITESESETKLEWKKGGENEYALYFKFNELEFAMKEDGEKLEELLNKGNEYKKQGQEKVSDSLASLKAWANKPNTSPKRKMSFAEMERLAKTFRDSLNAFFKDFVAKMKAIKELLCTVPKLMKKFPQLGFKLETEIGFLGGDMFAQWGMVNVDSSKKQNTALKDRYAPLFPKIHLETTVSLIKFKIAGSFGAMIDMGFAASAKARVEVALTMELKWTTWLEIIFNVNGNDADRLYQGLSETTKGEVSAEVEVKTVGITIVHKKIGLESGITIGGAIVWELANGKMSYQVTVQTLETGWYYYSNDIKSGQAHASIHQIFAPQLLHRSEGLLRF